MSQQTTHAPLGVHGAEANYVTTAGTAADGHKAGLPQLNTDDFAPQLVWLALTFAFLYFMMSRVALPRIGDALERRRDQIASDIDTARALQQEAEDAEVAYKTSLADAKAKAHGIAQETKDSLNAQTDSRRKEVEAQINAKLQEAEQRINASKTAAMSEVSAIASSTTKEIVSRLVGSDVSDDELSTALSAVKH